MDDRNARLQEVARIAVALQAQTGCPAQLMTAQWAVESQWGAKPAGHANYFGIKMSERHKLCCTVTTREVKKTMVKAGNSPGTDDKNKPAISEPVKEYVFVYKAGKVKQVLVTTGIQDATYIQVLSGLKSGDEVVSAPFATIAKLLNDNMVVEKVDKSKLFVGDGK